MGAPAFFNEVNLQLRLILQRRLVALVHLSLLAVVWGPLAQGTDTGSITGHNFRVNRRLPPRSGFLQTGRPKCPFYPNP